MWQDVGVAFCEETVQTARLWGELGFDGLTEERFAVYKRGYRLFEAAQQLRHELSHLLNCQSDGLVPVEECGGEKEGALRDLYEGLLQEVLENEDVDDDEPFRT